MFLTGVGQQSPFTSLSATRLSPEQLGGTKWTVIFPNSTKRIAWDVCGLVLICYDLITIPFTQAFDPPDSEFSLLMEWITLCFWTCDMAQGFFLGFFREGEYVEDNCKVLLNYLKSWFLVDCIVVFPDWIMKILKGEQSGPWGELGKILKGARAIRVMRLLRLAKLQRIVNIVFDKIDSEYAFIVVNLMKLLLFVLVLNHLIACAWYGLAMALAGQTDTNWVETAQMSDDPIIYKYLTSLHWSLTQFTPAGMDISARNSPERLFSIVVLFFAMIAFSSIVANITSSMSNLRNMKGDHVKQFWLLRRYLKQRGIRKGLSERIFKFLDHRIKLQSGKINQGQIPVLQNLSEALQNELNYCIMSGGLSKHEFFRKIDLEMPVILHALCSKILSKTYAEDEVVFSGGNVAKKTFFSGIARGPEETVDFLYTPIFGRCIKARSQECIAEPTLWVDWRHQGELMCQHPSELFNLSPEHFQQTLQLHPKPYFFAVSYAHDFLEHIKNQELSDFIRDDKFRRTSMANVDCCLKQSPHVKSHTELLADDFSIN